MDDPEVQRNEMQSTTIKKFISSLLFGIQIFNLYSMYRYVLCNTCATAKGTDKKLFFSKQKKKRKNNVLYNKVVTQSDCDE